MASDSVSIFEDRGSNRGQHMYRIVVRGAGGEAIAGADIVVEIEGDGSLAPNFSSKEIHRETDAEGKARVVWYRRSIFGRDVKAKLTASSTRDGASVNVEPADDEDLGPRTGFTGSPWKEIGRQ